MSMVVVVVLEYYGTMVYYWWFRILNYVIIQIQGGGVWFSMLISFSFDWSFVSSISDLHSFASLSSLLRWGNPKWFMVVVMVLQYYGIMVYYWWFRILNYVIIQIQGGGVWFSMFFLSARHLSWFISIVQLPFTRRSLAYVIMGEACRHSSCLFAVIVAVRDLWAVIG